MNEFQQTYYPNIPQSWGIVGMGILFTILFLPLNVFLNNVTGADFSLFVFYLGSIGATFLFANWQRRRTTDTTYQIEKVSLKTIVIVSIATVAIQLAITGPIVSLIPMPDFLKEAFRQVLGHYGVFTFITIVILAPILEELIFRGIILDGLLTRYTPLRSIVLSSILFGLIHLNPWQFISAMNIGLFSGWVYYKTRTLTLSILIHFVNNLFAYGSGYFVDQEEMMNQSLSESYGGYVNLILAITGAISVAVIALYILKSDLDKSTTMASVEE